MKKLISHFFLCFLSCISPYLNFAYRYRKNFGKKMNLKEPKSFNEKIIWLELNEYSDNPLIIQCSDKYRVREYVQLCGCGDILVPLIGNWNNPKEIEWNSLPCKFVLKWNFGASFNFVCTDKGLSDKKVIEKKMVKWGRAKYWLWYGEAHYKKISKKIIGEQYISGIDSNGNLSNCSPEDYKFYCFNGKVQYILVCMNRKGMHADYIFFDTEWNIQPFSAYGIKNIGKINMIKPPLLKLAIEYAEKLASPFPFVRVDLYLLENEIYFGELTFTPCGGVDYDLYDGDIVMGKMLDIKSIKEI